MEHVSLESVGFLGSQFTVNLVLLYLRRVEHVEWSFFVQPTVNDLTGVFQICSLTPANTILPL